MQRTSYTIVLVCISCELAEAQRTLLEEHGHRVLVASDLRELERISNDNRLACAVLGEDIGDSMKHAIATQLRENLPGVAILEEYRVSPVLPDAEHILAGQPSDLLAVLDDLLLPSSQRHSAHLQRKVSVLREWVREARATAKNITERSRQLRSAVRREKRGGAEKTNGKHRT